MRRSIFPLIYTVVGVIVAINNGYGAITSVSALLSFVLAVLLWPVLFLGLSLHINVGF